MTDKAKNTGFDAWSTAELELRRARIAYKEATKFIVHSIIELNGSWPCADLDSEFVSVRSEDGSVMLELRPYDKPECQERPFYIHHLEKLDL